MAYRRTSDELDVVYGDSSELGISRSMMGSIFSSGSESVLKSLDAVVRAVGEETFEDLGKLTFGGPRYVSPERKLGVLGGQVAAAGQFLLDPRVALNQAKKFLIDENVRDVGETVYSAGRLGVGLSAREGTLPRDIGNVAIAGVAAVIPGVTAGMIRKTRPYFDKAKDILREVESFREWDDFFEEGVKQGAGKVAFGAEIPEGYVSQAVEMLNKRGSQLGKEPTVAKIRDFFTRSGVSRNESDMILGELADDPDRVVPLEGLKELVSAKMPKVKTVTLGEYPENVGLPMRNQAVHGPGSRFEKFNLPGSIDGTYRERLVVSDEPLVNKHIDNRFFDLNWEKRHLQTLKEIESKFNRLSEDDFRLPVKATMENEARLSNSMVKLDEIARDYQLYSKGTSNPLKIKDALYRLEQKMAGGNKEPDWLKLYNDAKKAIKENNAKIENEVSSKIGKLKTELGAGYEKNMILSEAMDPNVVHFEGKGLTKNLYAHSRMHDRPIEVGGKQEIVSHLDEIQSSFYSKIEKLEAKRAREARAAGGKAEPLGVNLPLKDNWKEAMTHDFLNLAVRNERTKGITFTTAEEQIKRNLPFVDKNDPQVKRRLENMPEKNRAEAEKLLNDTEEVYNRMAKGESLNGTRAQLYIDIYDTWMPKYMKRMTGVEPKVIDSMGHKVWYVPKTQQLFENISKPVRIAEAGETETETGMV